MTNLKTSYTDNELSTAAKNLVLNLFPEEQVTKITKVAHVHCTTWGDLRQVATDYTNPLTIVSVRIDNKFRKPKTRKVYVHTNKVNWDTPEPITIATDGCHPIKVDEALTLEVVNNDYSNITKEPSRLGKSGWCGTQF